MKSKKQAINRERALFNYIYFHVQAKQNAS